MDPDRLNQIVEAYTNLNPEKPLISQYISYMSELARGDLGKSIYYGDPVVNIIAGALPWTVLVMSVSLVLIFGIGILLGAAMAFFEGGKFDTVASIVSTVMASTPFYVLAIWMVFILGYRWGMFPTGGRYNTIHSVGLTPQFLGSVAYHAVLPVTSLVLTGYGTRALTMRGNSISVLGSDYMRVADLRGIRRRIVITRYVVRNAVLPMYTSFLIAIGFMFGGSVILEVIFQYFGLGYYLYQAVNTGDIPLLMGTFLIITISVVFSIFIGDLTYGRIDPRAGGAQDESY